MQTSRATIAGIFTVLLPGCRSWFIRVPRSSPTLPQAACSCQESLTGAYQASTVNAMGSDELMNWAAARDIAGRRAVHLKRARGPIKDECEALINLEAAAWAVESLLVSKVVELREHGSTWDDIASPLGVSRQAAHAKYGKFGHRKGKP